MFTDLEVIPLKVSLRHSGLVLAVLGTMGSAPLVAQSTKTGDRVMIPVLQSSDKELGVQAAEAIRNQLQKQTNVRDLVVVPKADIENSLKSSGYSTTEALAPGDAKALATLVRRILDETTLEQIRFSSIEPQHINLAVARRKHIDLPMVLFTHCVRAVTIQIRKEKSRETPINR